MSEAFDCRKPAWTAYARRLLAKVDGWRRGAAWHAEYWRFLLPAFVHRQRLGSVAFVGITGSAGKTATKDLSAAVLGAVGPCRSTDRSTNEHVGVAETVLATRPRDRFSVVELSAGGPGKLDRPLRLVRPRIAVLTLVARDHYTAFKSVDAIAEEKGKVVSALPADGVAVLNIDDPRVRAIGEACGRRVIWIGTGEGATLRLVEARSRYPEPLVLTIEHGGERHQVRTGLHGTHLALPVLAALGVGVAAGVPLATAITALADAVITPGRMQVLPAPDGVVFLRDDWKAPLWSFDAPLEFLRQANAQRKVLIIGTLSDYSLSASKLYPKIARQALEIGELVVFVGPHALRALKARRHPDDRALLAFPDIGDAAAQLRELLRPGDLVLVKGSHKADHLTRIILDRFEPVSCWDSTCRRSMFCETCSSLRAGDGAPAAAGMIRPEPPVPSPSRTGLAVVVGLGNPGDGYRATPHNVGQRAVEILAESAGAAWEPAPEGLVAAAKLDGKEVMLLQPGVAMNRSGSAVQAFLARMGCEAHRCILVHDDVDLVLGDVRVKREGGDGGHKGVRSVLAGLDTGGLVRIRIGVRRHGDLRRARALVLERFQPDEETMLAPALARAASLARESVRAVVGDTPVPEIYRPSGIGEATTAGS